MVLVESVLYLFSDRSKGKHTYSVKAKSKDLMPFSVLPVHGSTGSSRTEECCSAKLYPFALSLSKGETGLQNSILIIMLPLNRIRMKGKRPTAIVIRWAFFWGSVFELEQFFPGWFYRIDSGIEGCFPFLLN